MKRLNTISDHAIQFCRFLRQHRYNIGTLEEQNALEALAVIPFHQESNFVNALKVTLVKNKSELDHFDQLYSDYWNEVKKGEDAKVKDKLKKEQQKKSSKKTSIDTIKSWLYGNQQKNQIDIARQSDIEVLTDKDFSFLSADEMKDTLYYTALLVRKMSVNKGRRYIQSPQKHQLDLRKIARKNFGKVDEVIYLNYKKPKPEKLKLVIICDVSRSMELYAKFLMHFIYGLNRATSQIETFVFSTQLKRITPFLREREFKDVLEDLRTSFEYWSGGTRIGESLGTFVEDYGGQILGSKTKVIIVSDGWDNGNPEIVKKAMEKIQRKSGAVIWLNPLAGNPGFEPKVACLQAAMPYIDIFQAANTIESLKELVRKL